MYEEVETVPMGHTKASEEVTQKWTKSRKSACKPKTIVPLLQVKKH